MSWKSFFSLAEPHTGYGCFHTDILFKTRNGHEVHNRNLKTGRWWHKKMTQTQHSASCVATLEAQIPGMTSSRPQSRFKNIFYYSQELCLIGEKGRESRLWPVHRSAWTVVMGDGSGEKIGPKRWFILSKHENSPLSCAGYKAKETSSLHG